MAGVSKRQGCSGQVKVERLFAGPSVMVSGEQVGPSASFKSNPWKARGISLPWSSNQAPRKVGSRLGDRRRGNQGIAVSDRGVTSRARGAASSCAPSACRRGECVTAAPARSAGPCHSKKWRPRLQGRKTLASLPGCRLRERPPHARESDGGRRCHTMRRKRVWWTGRPKRPENARHRILASPSSRQIGRASCRERV